MKLIKRFAAFGLVTLLLITPALAATSQQQNTADALNHLGLFLGVGGDKGYALDDTMKRSYGITLLVRLMGMEEEAQSGKYSHPFTDVPQWLDGYVAYAYETGITNGGGGGLFLTDSEMTDYMYLTLILRALGYSDAGEDAEYTWTAPYALAQKLGLISYSSQDAEFTRGDAVDIFWNALSVKLNGTDQQLQEHLIEQGVFTAQKLRAAIYIQLNGVNDTDDTGGAGGTGSSESSGDAGSTGGASDTEDKVLDNYTWEDYSALKDTEKEALYEQYFGNEHLREYIVWLKELKAEYDARQNVIIIDGGGSVDLGEILDQIKNGND